LITHDSVMSLVYIVSREFGTQLDGIAFDDEKIFCSIGAKAEHQIFAFVDTGDGYYRIVHKHSGKELVTFENRHVQLSFPQVSYAHHWKFDIPIEGKRFYSVIHLVIFY
jgi:hypothetical protein